MSANSGNRNHYNTEDIRRYVQGEMSDTEMHAIEKAALDDDLLSDAIEGYSDAFRDHGMGALHKSAVGLQTQLNERLREKKRKNLAPVIHVRCWQAAIAAGIIITAGVLGYRSYTDRAETVMLSVNDTATREKISPADTVSNHLRTVKDPGYTTPGPGANAASNASDPGDDSTSDRFGVDLELNPGLASSKKRTGTIASSSGEAKSEKDPRLKPADNIEAKDEDLAAAPLKSPSAENFHKQQVITVDSDSLRKPAPETLNKALAGRAAGIAVQPEKNKARNDAARKLAPVKGVSAENKYEEKTPIKYYKGQIVTTDKKPISNAVLKLVDSPAAYTTDNNGNFVIPSRDTVLDVNVMMVGSQPTRFRLQNNNSTNQLILPDSQNDLAEVVVIGYGTQRKRDLTGSVSIPGRQAEPSVGWIAFEQYLEKNKDSTLVVPGNPETQLSFQVSSGSKISKFEVIESISPKHDAEIIRLIKQGPKWKLLKGRKATVTITLRF